MLSQGPEGISRQRDWLELQSLGISRRELTTSEVSNSSNSNSKGKFSLPVRISQPKMANSNKCEDRKIRDRTLGQAKVRDHSRGRQATRRTIQDRAVVA